MSRGERERKRMSRKDTKKAIEGRREKEERHRERKGEKDRVEKEAMR